MHSLVDLPHAALRLRRVGAALMCAIVSIWLAPAIASASPAGCSVPKVVSDHAPGTIVATAVRDIPSGLEQTDYIEGGSVYRTIRCSSAGDFDMSMTVGAIMAPDGQVAEVPLETIRAQGNDLRGSSVLYPDFSSPAGAALWARDGGRSALHVLPAVPSAQRPALQVMAPAASQDPSTFASTDAGCSQTSFTINNSGWLSRAYHYWIDAGTIPAIPGTAHGQLLSGHHVWNNTTNPCGFADITNFTSFFDGDTTIRANATADGVNVVDFGSANFADCNTVGLLACTVWFTSGSFITEADERFVSANPWSATDTAPAGTFDVYSTATHESGHALGLGHTSGGSTNFLTMYPFQCDGCIRERDLGRGDVNGLRSIYP